MVSAENAQSSGPSSSSEARVIDWGPNDGLASHPRRLEIPLNKSLKITEIFIA